MSEEIFEAAKKLVDVPEGEWPTLQALAAGVSTRLMARLREGITLDDCANCFIQGGAWLTLADRAALTARGQGFTAGSLTVRESQPDPEALRRRGMEILAPFLADEGFCFAGVVG